MSFGHEDIRSRFEGDILPDGTWGICKLHGIVNLVDDDGNPTVAGFCGICREESNDERFFTCPVHGIQPKTPGQEGCPVKVKVKGPDGTSVVDCLGKGAGPTEDEVAREAEQNYRVWPGGPPVRKNVLDAPEPRPPIERDREVVESAEGEAGGVPALDGSGVEDGPAWRDSLVGDENWKDPFLEP